MSKEFAVGILAVLGLAMPALGQSSGVVPPDQSVAGQTQAEWSEDWWRYTYSIPAVDNPFLDSTGVNAGINQSGPVFFLGISFSGPDPNNQTANRTIEVNKNKNLFFPLVTSQFDELQLGGLSVEQLRGLNQAIIDTAENLFLEIDGLSIPVLENAR
ncbi:MAG: hypothetical protein HC835_19105 [Oscillatoriales cyanobacterium RM2_1_1]|nr:hypothetical protein [Oscillatoriales cyanobacterium RM2_1_1]